MSTVLWLAVIQLALDTSWCVGLVLLADRARDWLSRSSIRQRFERMMAAVLIALGLGLAVEAR